ncbi:MAG: hypothetical protein EA376_00880 [Phycisphaeraceae bacterium]|nr:MAG: hypothetical protein EA376_00880 [Phycisphaeraceae bacterium]
MSTLMEKLITDARPAPPKLLVYGEPGVGKTTFAAGSGCTLVDCENGAGNIPGLKRTQYLKNWNEIHNWLVELIRNADKAGPVAIDTIDWMIHRITEHVIIDLEPSKANDITNTIGSSHGGYYKARDIVINIVSRELLPALNELTARGCPVILLAHASNVKITTPEGFDQRLAGPDLPHWIAPLFIEWADGVLYAHRDFKKDRVLRTTGNNLITAKNRYSMPEILPLDWGAVVQAIARNFQLHTADNPQHRHGARRVGG